MKVSDAVAKFLALHVKHVFCISGGASLHLIHSIAARKDLSYVCPQNEQSAGFAADAYARLTGFGCALATSGPGATNLVTPIAASYYDSVPVLYITGNQTVERLDSHGTRQYGFQATPIVEIARPITKWAKTLDDPHSLISQMWEAVRISQSGRPGPVLVDIPDDVQRSDAIQEAFEFAADKIVKELVAAKSPVLIYGAGIKCAGAERLARDFAAVMDIRVCPTWGAIDLFPGCGSFGTHGSRDANVAVQSADYILCIGARLDTKATGFPVSGFAPKAKLVMVDIDMSEMRKMAKLGRPLHGSVRADARDFLEELNQCAITYQQYQYDYG